jgi:hypothetical protein
LTCPEWNLNVLLQTWSSYSISHFSKEQFQ